MRQETEQRYMIKNDKGNTIKMFEYLISFIHSFAKIKWKTTKEKRKTCENHWIESHMCGVQRKMENRNQTKCFNWEREREQMNGK